MIVFYWSLTIVFEWTRSFLVWMFLISQSLSYIREVILHNENKNTKKKHKMEGQISLVLVTFLLINVAFTTYAQTLVPQTAAEINTWFQTAVKPVRYILNTHFLYLSSLNKLFLEWNNVYTSPRNIILKRNYIEYFRCLYHLRFSNMQIVYCYLK